MMSAVRGENTALSMLANLSTRSADVPAELVVDEDLVLHVAADSVRLLPRGAIDRSKLLRRSCRRR
jgi:hypothetical protein